jgi:tetratricopeptide (TPR) repeat protein
MLTDSLSEIAIKGNKLYSEERYSEAENIYRRGIALYPGESLLQRNLSFCLLQQKRYEEAAINFRKYLSDEANDNDPEAHHGLAHSLFNCTLMEENPDLKKETIQEMNKAIEIAPNDLSKPDNLAKYYWQWNEYELAYSVMLTVVLRSPFEENRIDDFIKIVEFLQCQERAIAATEQQSLVVKNLEYLLAHLHKSAGNDLEAGKCLASAAMQCPWQYKIGKKMELFANDATP